jgi:ATP-dependent RNA helicase RhlE
MDKILSFLPTQRQNLLFSATLSKEIQGINRLLLKNPLEIKIEDNEDSIALIEQSAYLILDEQKGPLLRYLLKTQELKQVLIFTSSVYKADQVAEKLTKNGFSAQATHSKKSQRARNVALADFKSGKLDVLIATDLLSRGVDIDQLPVVINYELPRSPKDFIHRIGRTGRAESKGLAITFVTKEELHHFKIIQKKMGKWIQLTYTDELDLKGF